jgi:hypothetical protein
MAQNGPIWPKFIKIEPKPLMGKVRTSSRHLLAEKRASHQMTNVCLLISDFLPAFDFSCMLGT